MANVDPKKKVKIKLPRVKGGASDHYVSVNNHRMLIKRGVTVEVPYYIAAVIDASMAQDEATAEMVDGYMNGSLHQ